MAKKKYNNSTDKHRYDLGSVLNWIKDNPEEVNTLTDSITGLTNAIGGWNATRPVEKAIGLPSEYYANGGHLFDVGGWAGYASTAIGGIADVVNQAKGIDVEPYMEKVNNFGNREITASNSEDLLNTWSKNNITLNKVNKYDVTGGNPLSEALGRVSELAGSTIKGFTATGNPIGAAIGGGLNLIGQVLNIGKTNKQIKGLNKAIKIANAKTVWGLNNAKRNVGESQYNALLANYQAFGGPLFDYGSNALAYDLAKDAQYAKMLSAQNKGTSTSYIPPTEFAEGGQIHIKPSKRGTFTAAAKSRGMGVQEFASKVLANKDNYSPAMVKKANFARNASHWHDEGGMLLSDFFTNGVDIINNGGTHEQNPNDGVIMGIAPDGKPNLVEEGEAIFNDYVFSNRLRVPKAVRNKYKLRGPKDMTFAEAFIEAQKESEERPNDPISKNGLNNLAMILAQTQELVRNAPKRGHRAAKGGHLFKEGDILEKYREDVPEENIPEESQAEIDAFWKGALGDLDSPQHRIWYMENQNPQEVNSKLNPLRYAPIAASGYAVASDLLGLTNNPTVLDYIPGYHDIGYTPLGNYIPVTHTDTRYQQIQNAQQAAATRNAILQSSSPSRNAALLAADFNAQIANGELLRQGELQEYDRLLKREEFNRDINRMNTEWGLNTADRNRSAALDFGKAALQQAITNEEISNNMKGAKAKNVEGLAEAVGAAAREKEDMDLRDMLIRAGVFGVIPEKPANWTDRQWFDYQMNTRKACNGGKLKRRKKGLTY